MDRRVKLGDDQRDPCMTDMTNWPNLRESDFIIRDFRFASGETLPELRQHYLTLGTPQRDAAGASPTPCC